MPIPKIIIQSSINKLPKYTIDMNKQHLKDWEYLHFNDEEILDYIKNNPISEFPNSEKLINELKGPHKTDFFRYYYIYLNGGVFLDSDALLLYNIEDIIKDNSFFSVKSIEPESIFNGFIGAEAKHPIIYQALKHMCIVLPLTYSVDYFAVTKNLNLIINNYISFNPTNNIKLFKEHIYVKQTDGTIIYYKDYDVWSKIKENYAINPSIFEDIYSEITDDNNNILAIHYIKDKIIKPNYEIPDRKQKEIKNTTIGLTLDLPDTASNFFMNGIRQNVLYLAELLINIGYNVYFIINNSYNIDVIKESFYREDFKYIKMINLFEIDFDLVIQIGFEIDIPTILQLKYQKTKIVSYCCGNSYIIDSETILYDQHKNRFNQINYIKKNDIIRFDEVWSIPQMTNTNQYYWEILYRQKCIEVPFVWSNNAIKLIQLVTKKSYDDLLYKPNVNTKNKISIFEPNISIMKWALPSLLICESAYRKKADIKHVYVNNIHGKTVNDTLNSFNLHSFNSVTTNLNLFTDGKITIEGRFNTLDFMSNYGNIVVSHQWENNLNYIYFDLCWMGWPIIHNASLCKDIGYYYKEFNYEEGSQKLIECIENHENNSTTYLTQNRENIDKFLPTNIELQNKYIELINNLFMDNTETFNTKYGLITLYKNEYYIGYSFKNDIYWDIDNLLKLKEYINPNRNILEIGAHCGTSSIVYSSFLNNDNKVYAYEPQRNMFNLLVKNINQNNLQNKIIPYNLGVFCFEGNANMNNIDLDGGGGIIAKRYNEENNLGCNFGGVGLGTDGEDIKLTTIDNMILDNIGFIHCDAQGAESFIFSKALNTIKKNRPIILYENNMIFAKYLYNTVCNSYPTYTTESVFDIKKYCMEELNYSTCIDNFNGSIDTLLIP